MSQKCKSENECNVIRAEKVLLILELKANRRNVSTLRRKGFDVHFNNKGLGYTVYFKEVYIRGFRKGGTFKLGRQKDKASVAQQHTAKISATGWHRQFAHGDLCA